MRVVYYTMGWVLIFTAGFCVIRLGYENIDMTSQRLFITFWDKYLCYFMICILGVIWIKFADRLSKHSKHFILKTPSKNEEAPTWQTMNDLAKEIREENLMTKIPLTNEIWINSKTNELVHIRSGSGNGKELMFTNGFGLFISSLEDFLKDHKFINGIESKKDLEIFELKELLNKSHELNASYEKTIKEQKELIKKYRTALEFYADKGKYTIKEWDASDAIPDILQDRGGHAREALK